MAERIARLNLTRQEWTGWSRQQPSPITVRAEARRGQILGLREFGVKEPALESYSQIFRCRLRLLTLLDDRAFFEYQHLVVPNPGGGINLLAPQVGSIMLRPGQRIELATPTMDGGLILTVHLLAIEQAWYAPLLVAES